MTSEIRRRPEQYIIMKSHGRKELQKLTLLNLLSDIKENEN